ncbi:serine hydrolase domain-containing protein [Allomuricauda sp. SCSIO 65647]|uniref:serine hydrolase domain-containing protein n=1 Tax=Allomuricauda sp. SCSIO 65647 TaxID=2908843 RepID=UPI001F4158B7|nr:serine hydrolase domain-containing protein [Muricauda sp. SCSIO 65647]UJH66599.1 beta-lactamase family protein [Muricauda sp. SCSIO 65647]
MKQLCIWMLPLLMASTLQSQKNEFPGEKREAVKTVFKKYIDMGIPGLALTVYSEETGFWSHTEGVANIEENISLTNDHMFYLQSVAKTYMAVAILRLYEKGKLDLNDPITKYVNYQWLNSKDGIDKITVRMLLNHTSGLPEYTTDALLVSRIIQDPLTVLGVPEMLSYIDKKTLDFEPGSRYTYRNTNYALLSLIADKVTGDHIAFMQKEIFKKLKLDSTKVLSKNNIDKNFNLVGAYWDVLQEGIPTNISKLQRANVSSMKGDDGMVASTKDAVLFMKGLVSGKLLKAKTLELMQEFVLNEEGEKRYGLGIQYYDLDVTYALGHSGGGIGAGCVLLYLPELDAIVFIATNFNTMMESPIRKKAENLQMDILMALFM